MSHDAPAQTQQHAAMALRVADRVPAMLAYWDANQVCRFANDAYRAWFGKAGMEIVGSTMEALLGPLYPLNLPYIEGALAGEAQTFERQIPRPDGDTRDTLATYTPDIQDGVVQGIYVHVADVTRMKELERDREKLIERLESALNEVRTLRGFLPICAYCKKIRDAEGTWASMEVFVEARTHAEFSHGICPACEQQHFPDFASTEE